MSLAAALRGDSISSKRITVMKIWLDDIRPAPEGWEWATNADCFWRIFWNHVTWHGIESVEAISFDNDLGEGETEGWIVANSLLQAYIREGFTYVPILKCHSANVAARPRIEGYFNDIVKVART